MDILPDDVILQIALLEPIKSIRHLCLTSKRLYNLLNNNSFWRERLVRDYKISKGLNILSWRDAYRDHGKVFGFGHNGFGQTLGAQRDLGNTCQIPTLISVGSELKAKAVSCNDNQTMVIDINDAVWTFGLSGGPNAIAHKLKAKFIASGTNHMMIIDLNNKVWAFGANSHGQLGLGDTENRNVPTLIPNINVKAVSCGAFHTIIIDMDDAVWAFGSNYYGELGLGDNDDRLDPTLLFMNAKSVSCGDEYTMIIDLNSEVWAFGRNNCNQLGLGDDQDRNLATRIPNIKAKAVSCGTLHTMLIDLNNSVWAFGSNAYRQLGLGRKNYTPFPALVPNIKAKSISCGNLHTMLIDLDNNIWAFGNNFNGQLGLDLGDNQNRSSPTLIPDIKAKSVSCGRAHTIIIISLISQFPSNVHLISFNEANRKLAAGDFFGFYFFPEYQSIPHRSENSIVAFYAKDSNIYLAEVRYDKNQILPPM